MRAFIAIPCPGDLRESLVKIQNQIKDLGRIRLVEPENIHLTLKFLGNVDENRIDEIIKCLNKVSKIDGFDISLRGVGVFPKPSYVRVVWVGVGNGGKEIKELHTRIDQELEALGFEREKRFSAHFTIARVKRIEDKKEFIKILNENSKREFGDFYVKGIELMKSELKRTGPVYSLVHRFDFE